MVINKKHKKQQFLTLVFILSLSVLPSCTPMKATHGNLLEEDRTSQVEVGISTREDVFRVLGSPTTVSPFDNNVWYYMGQKTEKRGIFDKEVTDEKIVIVQFDENNTVSMFDTMANARLDVPIKDSKTPTYGNEVTVLQQMLGNLGKFNPPVTE